MTIQRSTGTRRLRIASTVAQERVELAAEVASLRGKMTNLERALEHSRDIGVAIGIVMAAQKVTRDCAWEMLRMVSQYQNRKVRLIAADVIDTGELAAKTPA
jgi:AmiR/NasT family two-component response regulator